MAVEQISKRLKKLKEEQREIGDIEKLTKKLKAEGIIDASNSSFGKVIFVKGDSSKGYCFIMSEGRRIFLTSNEFPNSQLPAVGDLLRFKVGNKERAYHVESVN